MCINERAALEAFADHYFCVNTTVARIRIYKKKKNRVHNELNGFKQERVHGSDIEIKLGLLRYTEPDATGPKIGLGHVSILLFVRQPSMWGQKKKKISLY